jgi:hypothetical protein
MRAIAQVKIITRTWGERQENKLRKMRNTKHINLFDRGSTPKSRHPHCGVPKDEGCAQPFSSDPKIKHEAIDFIYICLLTKISTD